MTTHLELRHVRVGEITVPLCATNSSSYACMSSPMLFVCKNPIETFLAKLAAVNYHIGMSSSATCKKQK